jgi:hypothetical protein
MAKLPFVVEPRLKPIVEILGSDESGKIEVERRGYLSAGERAFVGASMTNDDTTSVILGIVRKIAKEYKMDMQECYTLVTSILTQGASEGVEQEVSEKYRDELNDIIRMMLSQEQRKGFVQAYCMLLYRVNSSLTVEDAMELHPDLLRDLAGLYVDEERKSVERLIEDTGADGTEETAVEDIEKK